MSGPVKSRVIGAAFPWCLGGGMKCLGASHLLTLTPCLPLPLSPCLAKRGGNGAGKDAEGDCPSEGLP